MEGVHVILATTPSAMDANPMGSVKDVSHSPLHEDRQEKRHDLIVVRTSTDREEQQAPDVRAKL